MSAEAVPAGIGREVVEQVAAEIREAAAWLSELDGASGDGDHGINMRTGMDLALTRVEPGDSVADAMRQVGETLLNDIGGAMGPLYGVFFLGLVDASREQEWLDAACVRQMLVDGTDAVIELGGADPGDKTLVDVLVPAVRAFERAQADGEGLADTLCTTARVASESRDATAEMVARVGRAARAGERSRGQIDAGAASCALILGAICMVFADNVNSEALAS